MTDIDAVVLRPEAELANLITVGMVGPLGRKLSWNEAHAVATSIAHRLTELGYSDAARQDRGLLDAAVNVRDEWDDLMERAAGRGTAGIRPAETVDLADAIKRLRSALTAEAEPR